MTATKIPSIHRTLFDPVIYAETFLRILTKEKKLIPLRYKRAQKHFLKHQTGRDLILKARQLGFSTMLQAELFRTATTSTATTMTLTHLDDITQAMRRMSDRFYDSIPAPFPKPLRAYSNAAVTTYSELGSECMIATAGSKNVGHGLTISHAHLSEVARWNNAEEVMIGVLEAVPTTGRVVVESTPNGQAGWFYDACMKAYRGEGEWTLHFYPWWWDSEYRTPLDDGERLVFTEEERTLIRLHDLDAEQIKWRRIKIDRMKEEFYASYPEDVMTCFLAGDGTSVFRNVRDVATACLYASAAEYLKDHPNARFVMGCDWGRDQDYSVFTVMDVTTWHVVAIHRVRHLDWHIQRARLIAMHKEWACERIVAERNSIGDVNISALLQDDLPVQAFYTTERSKKMLIDNLALALEERDIRLLPDTHEHGKVMIAELMAYQQKKTASGNYVYEGKPHDDCVMSLALALFAVKQSGAF